MRITRFENRQIYHVYNRGNNKRPIFLDKFDLHRFVQGLIEFNSEETIGSIYENSFRRGNDKLGSRASKLVNIIAYCLNPNHFHLVLEQITDNGISKFMHRQGTGYVKFLNEKYKSSGGLFQGRFKAIHVDSNEYLLHLSAYVNLNDRAHNRKGSDLSGPSLSSWDEYVNKTKVGNLCNVNIVLAQFKSIEDYKEFALESSETIKEKKEVQRSLELELLGSPTSK